MVSLFVIILLVILSQVINLSYVEQDTILDAHELYFYSEMVQSWGAPPDTLKMLEDMKNLHLMGCVFSIEKDSTIFWRYPKTFIPSKYISYSDSEYLDTLWNVYNPYYVSSGNMGDLLATYVDYKDYRFIFTIDYEEPSDFLIRFVPASLLTVFFGTLLFLFINKYLRPINLMRSRVLALEKGDLNSKIDIITEDELGSLSATINTMIENIKSLLNQKQQLLSDVSHELMSPLTRMQLLVELLPEHKNKIRLKNEILNLRNMILNLLLSDKLDVPYTNLQLEKVNFSLFLDRVIAKFPDPSSRIKVVGSLPDVIINIDEVKIGLALRNLIENAFKYGDNSQRVEISGVLDRDILSVAIHNYGKEIPVDQIELITKPFYRMKGGTSENITGFGLGLSITKKIVEAHGAILHIKSSSDDGTTVMIKLPSSMVS